MEKENTEKNSRNRGITAGLRQKLLEKYGYACAVCGVNNEKVPLELAHLVPLSQGGDTSEENLILLCPNCHRSFDRQPREIEFVSFLNDILRRHPDYSDVRQEVLLGRETRYRADLIVQRRFHDKNEPLLIECKTPSIVTSARIQNVIAQLQAYRDVSDNNQVVLAVPATLRDRDLSALRTANIEVWDLRYLGEQFSEQIQEAPFSYYKALLLAQLSRPAKPSREQKLLDNLAACQPGKTDWYVYQSLVGDILECLFTPPLGKPIPELSDKAKANRRDFIMPNYTDKGFWAFMREKYQADYVVVDAKNYTRKVKKSEALQIANYLKPHGAGLFGIIISRKGGDTSGCEHTLREQWMVHRKLILVLDDDDIKEMLIAKSDGRVPEEIVGQKIEQFRLSM
ncbi:MAG: HNH endonuclease [Deltaproteobacteria bacterium]|nr:HNH endonuclease [Deltaproteobacteria bacterium]